MFTYRFINFEYNFSGRQFVPIQMHTAMKYDELRATYLETKPESQRQVDRIKYGQCIVDVPEKTVLKLLTSEVLNPFYIFQIFAVALWIYDYYLVYASCIFIVSLIGVVVSIIENVQNNRKIRQMARYTCDVELRKSSIKGEKPQFKTVDSAELLPGDIIVIPQDKVLPCDLVILTGSVIVNEAMLTGESVPVMKFSLPVSSDEVYSTAASSKYSLFGGTTVI